MLPQIIQVCLLEIGLIFTNVDVVLQLVDTPAGAVQITDIVPEASATVSFCNVVRY